MTQKQQGPVSRDPARTQRLMSRMLATLCQKNEGNPVFSDDDIRSCLVYLYLKLQNDIATCVGGGTASRADHNVRTLLGIAADDSPEEAQAKVDRFFIENPLNPHLSSVMNQMMAEFALEEQPNGPGEAARKLLGQTRQPDRGSPTATKGEVIPAGPLGQAALRSLSSESRRSFYPN